jgi:hypothetical protein
MPQVTAGHTRSDRDEEPMSTPYPPTGPENPDPTGGQAPVPGADPYPAPQTPPAPPVHGGAPQQPTAGEPTAYPGTAYPGVGPAYPGAAPAYPGAAPAYPGGDPAYGVPGQDEKKAASTRTLSIIALVTAIIPCTSLIGLVLGIVGLVRGRGLARAGKGLSIAAVIIGAIWLVIAIGVFALFGNIWQTCSDLGPGTHYVDGVQYTCGDNF